MFSKSSNFLPSLVLLFLTIQSFVVHSVNLKSEKEYFKNFQNLKDSIQEGHTVEGLSEVKQYLQNYGYYPSHISELNENFDETLTSALQTCQKYHHLNVTGALNFATIKQMMVPRCGFPDIVNHKHLPNTGKLHMVSHYRFLEGRLKWPTYDLTYKIIPQRVVNPQILSDVLASAFRSWSAVSRLRFRKVSLEEESKIKIGFAHFDGPGGTLGGAYGPPIGVFNYDADESWNTTPVGSEVDLESMAIHQIGHVLGLGHSQDPNAIMNPSIHTGAVKRYLEQDDMDVIRTLYP